MTSSTMMSSCTLKLLYTLHRMTKQCLLKVCKELKLYRTLELNDVLYLHFKGVCGCASLA